MISRHHTNSSTTCTNRFQKRSEGLSEGSKRLYGKDCCKKECFRKERLTICFVRERSPPREVQGGAVECSGIQWSEIDWAYLSIVIILTTATKQVKWACVSSFAIYLFYLLLGITWLTVGTVGTWTNTGCPRMPQSHPIALSAPRGIAAPALAAIAVARHDLPWLALLMWPFNSLHI